MSADLDAIVRDVIVASPLGTLLGMELVSVARDRVVVRLPFRRFLLYDLICATLVVGVFFGASYLFGDQVARWIREAERAHTPSAPADVGARPREAVEPQGHRT